MLIIGFILVVIMGGLTQLNGLEIFKKRELLKTGAPRQPTLLKEHLRG